MNKYELALVLSAKIEDDDRAALLEKAKGYITRYEGVIGQVEEWGRRRLAYEVAHQREGYYYFIHFEADGAAPAQIESHVRILDNMLRFLIVRKDGEDIITPVPEQETEEAPLAEIQPEEVPAEEAAAEEAPAEAAEPEASAEEAPAEE